MTERLFNPRNPVPYVAALIVVGLCLKAIFGGTFGSIGTDNDDVLRLMQIRDFLAGQSWFDVTQTRMGLEAGTDMHWSRLADIPILILYGVFTLFLPQAVAESLAISLWPPLSALIVIWGVLVGVKNRSGGQAQFARTFALILLVFGLVLHYRFAPGSIDHHNLQLGLLAVAVGYALDPEHHIKSGFVSGIALALSASIGVEVYGFVAAVCAWFAIMWTLKGEAVRDFISGFGISFGVVLVFVFFLTVPPSRYGLVACDSLSLITLAAGATGGIGLGLMARWAFAKTIYNRLMSLGVLGVACGVILIVLGPQCLANPLKDLPPEVKKLWLGQVVEARPLFSDPAEWFYLPLFAIGTSCVALLVLLGALKNNMGDMGSWLLIVLLAIGVLLTFYQIRFYVFGSLLAIICLAPWIANLFAQSRRSEDPSIGYILALAASIPLIWGFPAIFLKADDPVETETPGDSSACYSDQVMLAMSDLAPGLFVATSNGTPSILMHTDHRVLSGNYHRNVEGISANIRIFTETPQISKEELSRVGADYLHVCRTTKESQVFAEHSPDGLMAALLEGNTPAYLVPVEGEIEAGAVTLYRVNIP